MSCVAASADELAAYARVLKAAGKGAIEIALKSAATGLDDADYRLVDRLLDAGAPALTFLALIKHLDRPTAHLEMMERVAPLLARGARPQLHSTDLYSDLNLANPYMLSAFPSWHGVFNRPAAEQKRHYADPAFRRRWRAELATSRAFHGDFAKVWINNAGRADWRGLVGRDVASLAAERGQDPLDAFFDLALEDELRLDYTTVRFGVPEEFLGDPRTLIGLSDGGAHVGILCNAGYTTETLGKLVRERGLLSLELAVKRMTSEPADFFGLADRGRLQPGLAADIAIFDPATVGSDSARPEALDDLPGGGRRLVVRPTGMHWTVVNGQVLFEGARHSGAFPGRVLGPA
jgi:N-acyl-D-aspartate/D-glutamate deacylase